MEPNKLLDFMEATTAENPQLELAYCMRENQDVWKPFKRPFSFSNELFLDRAGYDILNKEEHIVMDRGTGACYKFKDYEYELVKSRAV